MLTLSRIMRPRSERGIVGINLVVVIAFALYAVIMLSRTTLAAKQIDDRVRVIVGEIGPGSNVSRLDETAILDTVGATAEAIDRAAANLSAQAGEILDIVRSIDNTVSGINGNANEINATVRSINASLAAALPVVQTIHGDGSDNNLTGGVDLINRQAAAAAPVVAGISDDLGRVFGLVGQGDGPGGGHSGNNIHAHVNSIDCAFVISLTSLLPLGGVNPGCNQF
jgi:hypothetical protein